MKVTLNVPEKVAQLCKNGAGPQISTLLEAAGLTNYEARIWSYALKNGEIDVLDTPEDLKVKKHFTDKGLNLEVNSYCITDLDEAIAVSKIDLTKYRVKDPEFNSWGVTMKGPDGEPVYRTNYQFKIKFELIKPEPIYEGLKAFIQKSKPIKKVVFKPLTKAGPNKNVAAEIAPFDMHFGKFAWHQETLSGNMDLAIAKRVFMESCLDNLAKIARWNPQRIYLILGQDLLHYENIWAKTPMSGHILDSDGRLPKVVETCMDCTMELTDACLQVAPELRIKRVSGNHDIHAAMFLARELAQRYRNNPQVVVDNDESVKKAELWGKLLVAWTHDASGRKEKVSFNELPLIWPDLWGKSRWREWHVGHKHKAEATQSKPMQTLGGVLIRQLAALSNIDRWHMEFGFTDAVPCCESFIWHKEKGIRASYPSFIDYLRFK